MGVDLCGCNNNPGPSSETNLVIISIYNNLMIIKHIQVSNKIEAIKANPNQNKTDIDTNSPFKSNYNTISQNDYKSINTVNSQQINTTRLNHEKEEVSYIKNKI